MTGVGYYAVPDPAGDSMTYWRRGARGAVKPWPVKARYGPVLYTKEVPAVLKGTARREWVGKWYSTVRTPWDEAIQGAIQADPVGCRARFTVFTSRCCVCGRTLTDDASKVFGIGPDCRAEVSDDFLTSVAERTARMHGVADRATRRRGARGTNRGRGSTHQTTGADPRGPEPTGKEGQTDAPIHR